jgi:cytochrome c oxidase subunit 3
MSEHPSSLAHHFPSLRVQTASAKLGMWIFIAQEILFFAGLFLAYATGRYFYPETYLAAHELLDWKMGGLNTIILLTSSLTMALAVRAAQLNDRKQINIQMILTMILAFGFLIVKYFEYSHKFHVGILPGKFYTYTEHIIPGHPGVFFGIYFLMTGMHGIHVLIGIGVMIWILLRNLKGDFSSENYAALENTGLYWHLVDLIWIFLYPLLYLVR